MGSSGPDYEFLTTTKHYLQVPLGQIVNYPPREAKPSLFEQAKTLAHHTFNFGFTGFGNTKPAMPS